jgi:hypothetical protein
MFTISGRFGNIIDELNLWIISRLVASRPTVLGSEPRGIHEH